MNDKLKRLLMIEDNEDHAELIRISFQERGRTFDLYHVRDGEEATHFLKQTGKYKEAPLPHVVLLDINLPKINGQEILELIRNDDKLKDLTVIVFSTSDDEKDRQWANKMNAHFVTKSFDFKEVNETFDRIGI